jgi:hypothetical protein
MNISLTLILGVPLLCLFVVLVLIVITASQSLIQNNRKQEIWPAFATRIGGVFRQGMHGNPDHIAAHIDEWPVYLDTNLTGGKQQLMNYTRLRAFFPPRAQLEAVIFTPDLQDEMQHTTNMTRVMGTEYGVSADLYLRTNQPALLLQLLDNTDLVRLINMLKSSELEIRRRRNWKGGGVSSAVYEVYLQHNGVVIDDSTLMVMYQLVEVVLRRLHEIGVAGKSFAE